MKAFPRTVSILCVALLWIATARAQQNAPPADRPLLRTPDLIALCGRVLQLMDSSKISVPELARAGEPVSENARQALVNIRAGGAGNPAFTYTFLVNLRAFLALSDAVPKPFPFPEAARSQFTELRDAEARLDAHFQAALAATFTQLRDPDRDALRRYSEANLKLSPPEAGQSRVIFLGDSITDGWRLNEYFTDRDFVNRGISGQITGQMLGRMKADAIDLKPTLMLILAGTNDIGRAIPLKAIEDNLTMLADLAEYNKIRPMFASLLPVSDYHQDQNPDYLQSTRRPPASIRTLNEWLQKFCGQRKYTYVDYYSQLVDSAGFLKAELSDDGLHPNAMGYRVMAPIALAAIDKAAPTPTQKKRRFPLFGRQ